MHKLVNVLRVTELLPEEAVERELALFTVAVSPDGRLLASSSHDTTVRLWDPSEAKLLRTLIGHTAEVDSVTVAASRSFAAATGAQSPVSVARRRARSGRTASRRCSPASGARQRSLTRSAGAPPPGF